MLHRLVDKTSRTTYLSTCRIGSDRIANLFGMFHLLHINNDLWISEVFPTTPTTSIGPNNADSFSVKTQEKKTDRSLKRTNGLGLHALIER
mmetsp:Transcript_40263/g.97252  ORF Transcript_40263/g.97252 Transcript_40263/m.97252 type:complete len:91 (+) Transcript_40263:608-880(+)